MASEQRGLPTGVLRVCATPLGNLEDITLRVLAALREADVIAAEDTRQTQKLLSRYDIHTPLLSYHEHNEAVRAEELIERLRAGATIALVSDAGLPGISDPGAIVVRRAVDEGLKVEVLPGPSAVVTAVVVSGLATERFVFEGFLPRKGKERAARIAELAGEVRTVVLYEAPHRLRKTLSELGRVLQPERRCAVVRELTKKFEEVVRGTLAEVESRFKEVEPRGEICVVIEGATAKTEATGEDAGLNEAERLKAACSLAKDLRAKGKSLKEAARDAAGQFGVTRNEVYQAVVVGERGEE